jgi:ABC-type transport system substrate-binding protein
VWNKVKPQKYAIAGVLFCLVLAAGLRAGANARSTEQLRMGLSRDIQSLNPFLDTVSTDRDLRSLVYECLVFTDKDDSIKPGLAASWEISKDSREYTFHLRRGVRFHNEKEMTASDVQWSIEYALDPRNKAYGKIAVDVIESVRAIDPGTLKIVLREPHVAFLSALDSVQSFPVVPRASIQAGMEKLPRFPPGTGPFQFAEWKPGEHIRLVKFKHYWQPGIPRVGEVILKPIADDALRFEAIRTGDLDLIERVPYDQVDRIRRREVKDLRIEAGPAAGMRKITFNTRSPAHYGERESRPRKR